MREVDERRASLKRFIESAQQLGVEMDEEEALQWLTTIASMETETDVVIDEEVGVYGIG